MCLAIYLCSKKKLPIITYPDYPKAIVQSPEWPAIAQRFYTMGLTDTDQVVRKHFSSQYIVYAGSYEGCSCGFNYGREYPDYEDSHDDLLAAEESRIELLTYIRKNDVIELYSCWEGDQALPKELERTIKNLELQLPTFVFREKELLHLTKPTSYFL